MSKCAHCSLLFNAGYAQPPHLPQSSPLRPRASFLQRRHRQHFGDAAVNRRRRASCFRPCVPHARANDEPPAPRHDWEGLIREFEARSRASDRPSLPPPPGVPLDEDDPEQFEMLPVVESAGCTALTLMLWNLGKIWRLDSLLLLFYPLPMFFIALRWGPRAGDVVLFTTLFTIVTLMGPLYAILYALNTGLMALVFSRALYWRWHWAPAAVAGGLAKGAGLALQFTWMSSIVRYNSWTLVAEQVKMMVEGILRAVCMVARKQAPVVTVEGVKVAVGIVLVLHSVLHVLFTYVAATMILDRIADSIKLKRRPRLLRVLEVLKKRAMEEQQRRRY